MPKILFVVAVICCLQSKAQIVEGTVKYSMQFDGMPNGKDNPMANSSATIYFKKGVSIAEMATAFYTMKTVTDTKGILLLMDGAGQKFFMRRTTDQIAKEKSIKKQSDPVIVVTKEKKKILGYECTKVMVTNPEGGNKITMWQTDKIRTVAELGPVNADILAKSKGFPLEIEAEQGSVKSKMTAIDFSTKPIPDAFFNVSTAGYTERKAGAPGKRPTN